MKRRREGEGIDADAAAAGVATAGVAAAEVATGINALNAEGKTAPIQV